MSKEIDSLVLMGHAYQIANTPPRFLREDVEQGLWYVRNGHTQWYNSQAITEQDKANLYASEAFLGLGDLAAARLFGYTAHINQFENPSTQKVNEVIDEISPLQTDETLDLTFNIQSFRRLKVTQSLIKQSLSQKGPDAANELRHKWRAAQNVLKRRGEVIINAYDINELASGVGSVDRSSIAPDMVEFDSDGNVTSEAHNIKNLADHARIQARPTRVPYYFTFRQENAPEMLANSLDDLRQMKNSIISC